MSYAEGRKRAMMVPEPVESKGPSGRGEMTYEEQRYKAQRPDYPDSSLYTTLTNPIQSRIGIPRFGEERRKFDETEEGIVSKIGQKILSGRSTTTDQHELAQMFRNELELLGIDANKYIRNEGIEPRYEVTNPETGETSGNYFNQKGISSKGVIGESVKAAAIATLIATRGGAAFLPGSSGLTIRAGAGLLNRSNAAKSALWEGGYQSLMEIIQGRTGGEFNKGDIAGATIGAFVGDKVVGSVGGRYLQGGRLTSDARKYFSDEQSPNYGEGRGHQANLPKFRDAETGHLSNKRWNDLMKKQKEKGEITLAQMDPTDPTKRHTIKVKKEDRPLVTQGAIEVLNDYYLQTASTRNRNDLLNKLNKDIIGDKVKMNQITGFGRFKKQFSKNPERAQVEYQNYVTSLLATTDADITRPILNKAIEPGKKGRVSLDGQRFQDAYFNGIRQLQDAPDNAMYRPILERQKKAFFEDYLGKDIQLLNLKEMPERIDDLVGSEEFRVHFPNKNHRIDVMNQLNSIKDDILETERYERFISMRGRSTDVVMGDKVTITNDIRNMVGEDPLQNGDSVGTWFINLIVRGARAVADIGLSPQSRGNRRASGSSGALETSGAVAGGGLGSNQESQVGALGLLQSLNDLRKGLGVDVNIPYLGINPDASP